MTMAIIVHGGAGNIAADRVDGARAGCKAAVAIGWRVLSEGGSALDAVEAAVCALEDNPYYNAGTGSCLGADGNIEMDAGIMEGHTLRVGAVAGIELIKNPIALARLVLESPHVLLVGKGAQMFALEQGMGLCRREDLQTERQHKNWLIAQLSKFLQEPSEPRYHGQEVAFILPGQDRAQEANEGAPNPAESSTTPAISATSDTADNQYTREEKHGTVGAVALDSFGTLAAATSTGGVPNKYPGRVGDSPLVGCGFYADDNAAISCTGVGEDFMRLLIAKRAADFAANGTSAREAAEAAISVLGTRTNGLGGLIIVDHLGNTGFAWNSKNMVHAYMTQELQEPITGA